MAIAASGDNPLVSATRYGLGRVVVLGNTGMLGAGIDTPLGRLLANAAAWGGGGKTAGIRLAGSSSEYKTGVIASLTNQVCIHIFMSVIWRCQS